MSPAPPIHRIYVPWYIGIGGVREDVTLEFNQRTLRVIQGRAASAHDFGAIAIIPGLVNAHTHLEFSSLSHPIPTTERFTDWIRAVVGYRKSQQDDIATSIRRGSEESLRSGTTLLGEIATSGWSMREHAMAGTRGVIFQELLGLTEERIAGQLDLARQVIDRRHEAPAGLLTGLSPHAPYTVHPDLFEAAISMASNAHCPLAMHLAETQGELELLADATGEFREMLTDFGLWRDGLFGGRSAMDYLKKLATCSRSLVIHGNYLSDDELRFVAQNSKTMTLVYCPRTHAAFGHAPHPWRRLLELGGSVAIGTDSRASNPDLSLFGELQFLAARQSDVSHLELLRLATNSGRRALLGDADGQAAKDDVQDADLCIVQWDPHAQPDPIRNLFGAGNRVVATMSQGQWRYVDPDSALSAVLDKE